MLLKASDKRSFSFPQFLIENRTFLPGDRQYTPACSLAVFFTAVSLTLLLSFFPAHGFAEIQLAGKDGIFIKTQNEDLSFNAEGYFQSSSVFMNNNLDLDSRYDKDKVQYFGIDYQIAFDLQYKDWIELYASLERNGPYDYDAPVLGRRQVETLFGPVQAYQNSDFLPELESFYLDLMIPGTSRYPLRIKTGLYAIEIGNGLAVAGYYENYGVTVYHPGEKFAWNLHYFRPDFNNRWILGHVLEQEESLGRGFQDTVANLYAADATLTLGQFSVQPYISFLVDKTGIGKRSNLFEIQTDQDLLGTIGADFNFTIGRLSLGFEAARNFGEAQGIGGEDIAHKGYILYLDAALDMSEYWLTPRSSLLIASGNKLKGSEESGLIQGSANRAFGAYSPTNTNIADSIYPTLGIGPLIATSNVSGLNFGIPRPGTFGDPYLLDNLIMPNAGIDLTPFEKLTISFDWWYLASLEQGIGSRDGISKKLSRDLGHEIDLQISYDIFKYLNLSSAIGFLMPGDFYTERRDDEGTDFSPFIRGDGEVDPAFYADIRLTLSF